MYQRLEPARFIASPLGELLLELLLSELLPLLVLRVSSWPMLELLAWTPMLKMFCLPKLPILHVLLLRLTLLCLRRYLKLLCLQLLCLIVPMETLLRLRRCLKLLRLKLLCLIIPMMNLKLLCLEPMLSLKLLYLIIPMVSLELLCLKTC